MPLPDFKKIPPVTIYEFKNVDETEPLHIPELAPNRKITDTGFLRFFLVSVIFAICFVSVTSSIGTDYNRFVHGYDKCGDTCGIDNTPRANINCSGKDLAGKPIMKYRFTGKKNGSKWIMKNFMVPDECVEGCDRPNRLLFHRCIPVEDLPRHRKANQIITFVEFVHDFERSIIVLILPMCLTALLLAICLLFCLYFNAHHTVFGILSVSVLGLFGFTTYVWYWFVKDSDKKQLLYVGIIATITIILLCIFICYFYDRYGLVMTMFTEATEAIFRTPYLTVVPVVTLLVLYLTATAAVFLGFLISSNQYIRKVEKFPTVHEYVLTPLAKSALTYLGFTFIWLKGLSNGCQCIVVAGPVSAHYFQNLNEKSDDRYPVLTSCYVLFRYHIGTVAFGSMFITILTVVRVVLQFFQDHFNCTCVRNCVQCCLVCLESVTQYLTKRAYIQTAMHGEPLYKSGVRAARLLWANLMDAVALDTVADFIIVCAILLVILAALGEAVIIHEATDLQLDHYWTVLLIGAAGCGVVVYFFMQVINVAVETIFICFCEDKLMNDGNTKPYFMSERLKTLISAAREATKLREQS
ncbi:choline transporter-like protein 3 [Zophobas morio]|uniref:choline transporter-like protein 3 n=1 Tax=Zophobas morio TaxID=2755281 RepID=UPI0030837D4B